MPLEARADSLIAARPWPHTEAVTAVLMVVEVQQLMPQATLAAQEEQTACTRAAKYWLALGPSVEAVTGSMHS